MEDEQVDETLRKWAWSLIKRAYLSTRGTKSHAICWGALLGSIWTFGLEDAQRFMREHPYEALLICLWLLAQADKLARIVWSSYSRRLSR